MKKDEAARACGSPISKENGDCITVQVPEARLLRWNRSCNSGIEAHAFNLPSVMDISGHFPQHHDHSIGLKSSGSRFQVHGKIETVRGLNYKTRDGLLSRRQQTLWNFVPSECHRSQPTKDKPESRIDGRHNLIELLESPCLHGKVHKNHPS